MSNLNVGIFVLTLMVCMFFGSLQTTGQTRTESYSTEQAVSSADNESYFNEIEALISTIIDEELASDGKSYTIDFSGFNMSQEKIAYLLDGTDFLLDYTRLSNDLYKVLVQSDKYSSKDVVHELLWKQGFRL